MNEATKLVSRSLDLDPTDPEAHRIMGVIQIKAFRNYEAGRQYHERALQLAPSDAYILGRCAAFYCFTNQPERAHELLDKAERLDPFLPVWVTEERVCALYVESRYDDAAITAPSLPFQTRRSRLYAAAACAKRGDASNARLIVAEAMAEDPTLSANHLRMNELYQDVEFLNDLIAPLRDAGLPNHQRIAAAAE